MVDSPRSNRSSNSGRRPRTYVSLAHSIDDSPS